MSGREMENEDEFMLKCLEILRDGRSSFRTINRKSVISEANQSVLWSGLSKRGRTNRKLNFTDLKVVDPAFRRGATLRLLSNVIILSVFDLRALVFHEKVQIFDPENLQSAKVSKQLVTSLRSAQQSNNHFVFELFVLDTLLTLVSKQATAPFESLESATYQMLKEAPRKNVAHYLSSLRLKKQQLYQIAENSEIPRQLLVSFLEEEAFEVPTDFDSDNLKQQTEDLLEQRLLLFRCLDSSILLLETIGQRVHRLLEEVNNREDVLSIGMDSFLRSVLPRYLVPVLVRTY
ncbi:mitochondrial magnesium transporter Mrs2p-like protein [Galdieria sulphuraria]|uniref:Mitochondrial magnesium transporter Mrs2p-like protein n=1 Tax=Galdieria sulphuraria TaxID=130081 RepID=M2XKC1_GALSU|nr:mitochondrial magnesium transporter Mrs2p-like protein [Galdieria sulphuraria]EME30587.1 mitochondrial magnesium transporter Mrs2p-like protein [Galdieria sulphuraria]|eukprot:XP_005707107.1 mitochondrial magnesium transporter Mrs2p-like protein [Galdieria sulphuraria]